MTFQFERMIGLVIIVWSIMSVERVTSAFESNIFHKSFNHHRVNNKYTSNMMYEGKLPDIQQMKSNNSESLQLSNDDNITFHKNSSISMVNDEFGSISNSTDQQIKYYFTGVDIEKVSPLNLIRKKLKLHDHTNLSRTTPLPTDIYNDHSNELKIVRHGDERITKRSQTRRQLLSTKKRRQLSPVKASAEEVNNSNGYIEIKGSPDLRITPISLSDIDYENADGEEFYEEMDELFKLKQLLNNENIMKSNKKKQRGDMNPSISEFSSLIDQEKIPIRGDIVTRSKRSYGDDQVWGFAEDEGYVSGEGFQTGIGKYTSNKNNNTKPKNMLARQMPKTQTELLLEHEKKLFDYIVRNRPIIVSTGNGKENKLFQNKIKENNINVIEKKHKHEQSPGLIQSYNDLENMRKKNTRIDNIPTVARIFISQNLSPSLLSLTTLPPFFSRGNFDDDIDFPGINPGRDGLSASNFPASQTQSPLRKSPDSCTWAILQCCPRILDNHRLTKCFEYMDCPGVNWDPNPCRKGIIDAAQKEIINSYSNRTKKNA